jgi:hypothetical protein
MVTKVVQCRRSLGCFLLKKPKLMFEQEYREQAQGLPVPIPNSAAELVEVINH